MGEEAGQSMVANFPIGLQGQRRVLLSNSRAVKITGRWLASPRCIADQNGDKALVHIVVVVEFHVVGYEFDRKSGGGELVNAHRPKLLAQAPIALKFSVLAFCGKTQSFVGLPQGSTANNRLSIVVVLF